MKRIGRTTIFSVLAAMLAIFAMLTLGAIYVWAITEIDVTGADAQFDYNGTIFVQGPLPTSSGTGLIDPFLTVDGAGNQQITTGYNTDGEAEFDTLTGGDRTHSLSLAAIPELEIDGTLYKEFVLDINKAPGGSPYLAMNALELYLTDNPSITDYPFAGTATNIFDLGDAVVLMDYSLESGSGASDLTWLVPVTLFYPLSAEEDCSYGSPDCDTYVVMYNQYGDYTEAGADPDKWTNNDGFEEWGTVLRPVVNVTKTATGTYERTVDWDIVKSVDPSSHELFAGESGTSGYSITVTKNETVGNIAVSGTIYILNATGGNGYPILEDINAVILSVEDVIHQGEIDTSATVNCGVEFPYTLGAGDTLECSYTAAPTTSDAGVNEASVTIETLDNPDTPDQETITFSGTKDVTFTEMLIGLDEITVDDTNVGGDFGPVSETTTHSYNGAFPCSADPADYTDGTYSYDHTNTATVNETGDWDDATVDVTCYAPVVTKDASPYYTRDWDWTITKDFDASYDLLTGASVTHLYSVTVTPSYTDDGWGVSGNIYVSNSHPTTDMTLTSVSDLAGGINAPVTCPSLVVPAGDSLTCTYDTDAQSSPNVNPFGGTNVATAVFAGANWNGDADIIFGDPTTENDPVITVDDDNLEGETWSADRAYAEWTYTKDFDCSADPADYTDGTYSYDHTNTATVNETGDWDDATVDVTCYWPADAKVIKTTTEGDEDIGQFPFTFELYAPDLLPGMDEPTETQILNSAGEVAFTTELRDEGTWTILEILPEGWVSTDASLECTFEVDYPPLEEGISSSAGVTYICEFDNVEKSRVDVLKLTNGFPSADQLWNFAIYEGPDGFDGTEVASDSTPPALLDFGSVNLDPFATYTLCELEVPAGFATFWQIDTDGDGIGDVTVVPYNPNADDDSPEDVGNRCIDFGANTTLPLEPGTTLHFVVDNQQPGGGPRTPGYWKNWNRCTGGRQQYTADANGGWEEGFWLVEDVLDPAIGGGITWDDILVDDFEFPITSCEAAVSILDARDTDSGKKMAKDAAYKLARSLLAAQLNFGAGACTTPEVLDKAAEAESLLDELDFNGMGDYLRPKGKDKTDFQTAIELAEYLDRYNNGEFCGGGQD
jgi:hypothetical protein